VNGADEYGTTPLMLACSANSETGIVRLLLRSGAEVNVLDDYRYSALMYAIYNDNAGESVPLLLKAGARTNVTGNDGYTPLIMAAYFGQADLVSVFLKTGVPINTVDDNGKSSLIHACEQGEDTAIIKQLLAAGADTSLIDETGGTAYSYASNNMYLEDDSILDRLESPLMAL